MSEIALFHSVLGVRPGVLQAADVLREAGHTVTVVDQYGGAVFDGYDEASAFAAEIGHSALMQRALESVDGLRPDLVYAGFSNGGGMAQFVAANRPGGESVVLLSGVIAPSMIGVEHWPAGLPVQIHYTVDDPFRNNAHIDEATALMQQYGALVEQYDYPGQGHLFTDASLPAEYDPDSAELLWRRVLEFLDEHGR